MSLRERFEKWLSFTRETMREMSFKQKISYLLYSYKGWLVGLLIVILFASYVGDAVAQSGRDIVLQGFFTNDDWGLFDAERLEKEYSSTLELGRKQTVVFDDDLYIDLGGEATEYTAASNGKLIAYMAVRELDFVVTTEAVLNHYEGEAPMLDLSQALPADMLEKLSPYLYIGADAEGNPAAVALNMRQSRFILDSYAGKNGLIDTEYYLFIPLLAPNPERVCEFIRWCFPQLF